MRKEQIITTTNNNQMEEKGMKQRFIHFKRKFVPALSGAIMGVMLILSILVDTFISKISFPMQPGPEIGSISDA